MADAYWNSIVQQRRQRNAKRANHEQLSIDDYVLTQPPVYTGPPRPRDPSKPAETAPPPPYVPVVSDFLADARQEFEFVPRTPQSESEFKRAYAKVALAAGLNAAQIVRIYTFEAGGNGEYDVQAGRERDKQARAITTALGYNQLLATNSVEIIAESGDQFVKSLQARAASPAGCRKEGSAKQTCDRAQDDRFRQERTRRLEQASGPGQYAEGARHSCAESGR